MLTICTRSEIVTRLDYLAASGRIQIEELASLKANMISLRSSLGAQLIGDKFVAGARQLLSSSDGAILGLRQRTFLDALRFDIMNDRYEDVAKAHSKTFHWLLEDVDYEPLRTHWNRKSEPWVQVGAIEDQQLRARTRADFVNWLGEKSGIFHITGKPGAGKSTLMKFIYQHPNTKRHLETWCAEKKLILAKSFFWRIGNELQKNLHGFQRSLLYQILSESPDLTPIAFPSQWDTSDELNGIHLTRSEVENGLDNIFSEPSVFQDRRFALFIDGLDEFDGRHSELLQRLFKWANNNPGDVKLCVSSRQWNVFRDAFVNCAKLQIHQFTRDGIAVMVMDRLAVCQPGLPEGQDTLELFREIVDKAEGVFLWVAIVLKALEGGITDGDGIPDLRAKVRAFPSELNGLYNYLFYSIHPCDRREAFTALMMTYHLIHSYRWKPLLRYHFFRKLIDNPAYAIELPPKEIPVEDLQMMLTLAMRRLNGKCKGFLEVGLETERPLVGNGPVKFMHATVEEFLSQAHIMSSIRESLPRFSWIDYLCSSLLAELKTMGNAKYKPAYSPPSSPSFLNPMSFFEELESVIQLFVKTVDWTDKDLQVHRLKSMNQFLLQVHAVLDNVTYSYISKGPWSGKCSMGADFLPSFPYRFTITLHDYTQIVAAKEHRYEYLECVWRQPRKIWHNLDSESLACPIMVSILDKFFRTPRDSMDYQRIASTLTLCCKHGLTPNYPLPVLHGMSYWQWLLCFFLCRDVIPCSPQLPDGCTTDPEYNGGPLVGLFQSLIETQVDPTFKLCFAQTRADTDHTPVSVVLGERTISHPDMWMGMDSAIVRFARIHHGSIDLRQLFKFWFPEHYRVLWEALDRNENKTRPWLTHCA